MQLSALTFLAGSVACGAFFVACKDPPSAGPSPAEVAAQASAREMAKEMLSQPTASTVYAPAIVDGKLAPLVAVVGFSSDGKTFAYIDRSTLSGEVYKKKAIVGVEWPEETPLDEEVDAGFAELSKAGFSQPKPVPTDLTFTSDLTSTTPKVTLARGGRTTNVALGDAPFPPTDRAELLGVSANGKYAAIHIAGPDVPGLLSKGGKGIMHFVFVAAIP